MADPEVSAHTGSLVTYLAEAPYKEPPASVVGKATHHLLDTLAAMVSGSRLPAGERGAAFAAAQHPSGHSTVAGTNIVTSASDAALANGMAAHADETDDSHPGSLSHPGCAIVPAALAVAEELGSTGAQLLRAVVAGYDVGTRVVLALGRPPVLTEQSSYSTHAYAAQFGAAAAAGVLHRLGAPASRHLLSYAAQSASGVTTWLRDHNHVEKAFVFGGMPAANGVRAARLVAAGCDGVDDVFSGQQNFLDAISSRVRLERLADGLGERYEIEHTNIKKFAVGSPAQAAVQATLDLVEQHKPDPRTIDAIEIVLPGDLAHVVDHRAMPDINVQYLVAATLLDQAFSFTMAHDDDRLQRDPIIAGLMAECTLIPDRTVSGVRTATVTLRMGDGRFLSRHVDVVRGTVADPMSHDEVVAKALDLLAPVLGPDGAHRVVDGVGALPSLNTVTGIGDLLAVSR